MDVASGEPAGEALGEGTREAGALRAAAQGPIGGRGFAR